MYHLINMEIIGKDKDSDNLTIILKMMLWQHNHNHMWLHVSIDVARQKIVRFLNPTIRHWCRYFPIMRHWCRYFPIMRHWCRDLCTYNTPSTLWKRLSRHLETPRGWKRVSRDPKKPPYWPSKVGLSRDHETTSYNCLLSLLSLRIYLANVCATMPPDTLSWLSQITWAATWRMYVSALHTSTGCRP